jgi:hypothetical protein
MIIIIIMKSSSLSFLRRKSIVFVSYFFGFGGSGRGKSELKKQTDMGRTLVVVVTGWANHNNNGP